MNTQTKIDELPDVLTVDEYRRVMRICRAAAYEDVRTGRVRSVRFGRSVRVPKKEVVRLLEGAKD